MTRFLYIGAHPDDADIQFAGTALQLIAKGHHVKFVSVSNGDAGHYRLTRDALAKLRYEETQASARLIGLDEYQVLDNHDCEIEPSLENRRQIIRIIRNYQPDVVISHWMEDYHADHRAVAQLVRDAAYLIMVPLYLADTPIPPVNPVFAFSFHRFTTPRPFRADAAVEFDSVLDKKLQAIACHKTQVFEWLPWGDWDMKEQADRGLAPEEKRQCVLRLVQRYLTAANMGRDALADIYGEEKANAITYAEAFEQTEYGRQVSLHDFRRLFLGDTESTALPTLQAVKA